MSLEELVSEYGYLAIFIGTFLEGETIQIIGGLAAQTGLLKLHWVIVAGCIGTLLGDQIYFFIGRRYGQTFLENRPKWAARVARFHVYLEKYHELAILSFRFFYGIRNVASFAMGTSHLPVPRFIILNALGAIIWAVVMASLGYFFGKAIESVMGSIKTYEIYILSAIGGIGLVFYLYHLIRNRRAESSSSDTSGKD